MDIIKADLKLQQVIQENSDVWKTESELFSWIRGGIRGGLWNRHPVKIKVLQKNRIKIPNPNPKGRVKEVWGAECALCKQLHVMKNIQVDHIDGGDYSLRSVVDIQPFFESIVLVTEKDLRLLCKDCNLTCTYAKRFNLTYEEAFCTKYIIKMIKEKRLDSFFEDRNLSMPKNKASAKEKAIKILLKEVKNV